MIQILKLIILSAVYISQFLRASKIFIAWIVPSWVLKILIMKDLEEKGNSSLWGKPKSLAVVKCGPVTMWISRAKPQECVKAWALSATEKVKEAAHWDRFALDPRSALLHRAVAVFGPLNRCVALAFSGRRWPLAATSFFAGTGLSATHACSWPLTSRQLPSTYSLHSNDSYSQL